MKASAVLLGMLGHRAGRASGVSGLAHRLAIGFAAAAIMLTAWLLVGAAPVFEGRDTRISAREPILLPSGTTDGAVARYLPREAYHHDRQFLVLFVEPLDQSAPPPPGLPRWPQPGEVFLSPALLDADPDRVLQHRYGRQAGQIGLEGLAEPSEWLVYARPPDKNMLAGYDGRTLISGFGLQPGSDDGLSSILDNHRSRDEYYLLVLLVVAVPTLVLTVAAVRSGSDKRDRRTAMLHALGAPRRAVMWTVAGEAALPAAVGAIVATAVAWATTLFNVHIPVVGYIVAASDLSDRRWWIILSAISVCLLLPALMAGAHYRQRKLRGTRPQQAASGWQTWPRIIFLLAIAAAIWSATTAYRDGDSTLYSAMAMVFLPATALALATVPSAVSALAQPLGRIIAGFGWRTGRMDALVAGRWLTHRAAALARACAAFVVGLGILALIQVWVSQNVDANQASIARRTIGDQLITVRANSISRDASGFIVAMGADNVLRIEQDAQSNTVIVGSCQALRIIGDYQACPITPTLASGTYQQLSPIGNAMKAGQATILLHGEPAISSVSPKGTELAGLLVHNPNGPNGFHHIAQTAYTTLAMPDVHTAEQHAISGSITYATIFSWLWTFAALGILILTITAMFGTIDVFLTQARSLGPIGSMSSTSTFYIRIAMWNIAAPITTAAVGGATVAALLGFLLTRLRASGTLSLPLLATGIGVVAVLGMLMAVVCGLAAARLARAWRPLAD